MAVVYVPPADHNYTKCYFSFSAVCLQIFVSRFCVLCYRRLKIKSRETKTTRASLHTSASYFTRKFPRLSTNDIETKHWACQ